MQSSPVSCYLSPQCEQPSFTPTQKKRQDYGTQNMGGSSGGGVGEQRQVERGWIAGRPTERAHVNRRM